MQPNNMLMVQDLDNKLNIVKQVNNEYLQDYYKRANDLYYLTAEFKGQGTRDLYMLANMKGTFSEVEIGKIAHQLLTEVR